MAKTNLSNLRVFIEDAIKIHEYYRKLTKAGNIEDSPFQDMPDVFVAATCIGAKNNSYKELKKKKDVFLAAALDQEFQIPVLTSLAYKKQGNLETFLELDRVLSICEGWANGGILLLYDILMEGKGLQPLYRLVDYIINEQPNN